MEAAVFELIGTNLSRVALLVIALLAAALMAQCALLDAEKGEHQATRSALSEERSVNNLLLGSQRQANATITGLQTQLTAAQAITLFSEQAAEKRCAIINGAGRMPAVGAGVVDAETSSKAARHIRDALSRF